MSFKNFRMWRGRLPHWRADDVTYYVTFRHRRELDERERFDLFKAFINADGRRLTLHGIVVLPDRTELIFVMPEGENVPDLSKIVESLKRRAGSKAVKRTGEVAPPFYGESFDRIIRDEAEYEERATAMAQGPVDAMLAESADEYQTFWQRPD